MSKSEKRTYIGYVSNVLRDKQTLSPRILLQDVVSETGKQFRDHVWVPYKGKLVDLRPKTTGNKHLVKIRFKAYEREYPSTSGGTKIGLIHLSYIEVID